MHFSVNLLFLRENLARLFCSSHTNGTSVFLPQCHLTAYSTTRCYGGGRVSCLIPVHPSAPVVATNGGAAPVCVHWWDISRRTHLC